MTQTIIIILIIIGAGIFGYFLYPAFNPPPELPEPILIPGKPVIEYRDTTIVDTLIKFIPQPGDLIPEPGTEYKIFEKDVSMFDGKFEMTLKIRAVDLASIEFINPRLHLQNTTITVTDTLRVPYAVEIFKDKPWYDTFAVGAGMTSGLFITLLIFMIIIL
jgi:hypothetical protein